MKRWRPESVGERVREVVSGVIQGMKDPRIGFVTVTGVDLSDDLKNAKVFISIYKKEEKETTLKAIETAKGFIRRELGKRMTLRYLPELFFEIDKSIEYGAKIDRLLNEIKQNENREPTHADDE